MKIGLTYNVRTEPSLLRPDVVVTAPGARDDEQEEFDSPATITALAATIESFGHQIVLLGDGAELLGKLLAGPRPDLVFNIAEGTGISRNRESRVPAILECFDIPCTASDATSLGIALDKDCAKRLVRAAGILTPDWLTVRPGEAAEVAPAAAKLGFPLLVKPAYEGSSKGIRSTNLVRTPAALPGVLAELRSQYQQPLLIEEFIDGEELTVGMVGNPPAVVGIMRIIPTDKSVPFVYSLEVKRDWKVRVQYECPPSLPAEQLAAVEQAALGVWNTLGLRDICRMDFRLRNGVPYFLEVNPLPGMSPETGDLIILAGKMGLTYRDLVGKILNAAIARSR